MVLVLPNDDNERLHWTASELVLRKCAYWCSLRNAPEVVRDPAVERPTKTVRVLTRNRLSPDALWDIMCGISRQEVLDYEG